MEGGDWVRDGSGLIRDIYHLHVVHITPAGSQQWNQLLVRVSGLLSNRNALTKTHFAMNVNILEENTLVMIDHTIVVPVSSKKNLIVQAWLDLYLMFSASVAERPATSGSSW